VRQPPTDEEIGEESGHGARGIVRDKFHAIENEPKEYGTGAFAQVQDPIEQRADEGECRFAEVKHHAPSSVAWSGSL
jgi:hypothetical protein